MSNQALGGAVQTVCPEFTGPTLRMSRIGTTISGLQPIGPRFYMILPYLGGEMNIIVIIRIYVLGVITQCTRYQNYVPRFIQKQLRGPKLGIPLIAKGKERCQRCRVLFSQQWNRTSVSSEMIIPG